MIFDTSKYVWSTKDYVDTDNISTINELYLDVYKYRRDLAIASTTSNTIEQRNNKNLIQVCNDVLDGNSLSKYSTLLNDVDKDNFTMFECDNTVFAYPEEDNKNLIILFVSMGDLETRYTLPYTSFRPKHLLKLGIPCIIVSEHGIDNPLWINPPNMIKGNGAADREKLIKTIKKMARRLSTCDNVFVVGDCRNVAGAMSFANELDFVNHVALLSGLTHHVPEYHTWDLDDPECRPFKFFTYLKAIEYQKTMPEHIINPFAHIRKDLNVNYWYGKYDDEYMQFKDYIEKFNVNISEIDYTFGDNNHYIMPEWDKKHLKQFILENKI